MLKYKTLKDKLEEKLPIPLSELPITLYYFFIKAPIFCLYDYIRNKFDKDKYIFRGNLEKHE